MKYFISPRLKVFTDNKIIRPNEKAEARARKIGTAKRVGSSMALRFVRRMGC